MFNSVAINSCWPVKRLRPENVKPPPAAAVVVCTLVPLMYKKSVAFATVVPAIEVVAVVKTVFEGVVSTGASSDPASALPPLPAAQK